jgi:beta-glucosidase
MKNSTAITALAAGAALVAVGCGGVVAESQGEGRLHDSSAAASTDADMPWADPSYRRDIPATIAMSRPEPGHKGWPLWMRHHEDRKRWAAERKVDLLMVGDSIVFRWSRTGKPVWDEYYAGRGGLNIGSSGDKTQHMLWHFQNGGLEGLKGRNPKLVLLMIGTNNRGKPEAEGRDTAYGILALLKEIRHRLPDSKILLLAIFPRGWAPGDPGRMRNDRINKIIRAYADGRTVHWLDLGPVFLDAEGRLDRELMPDGLHPGEKGYRAWAEAMEPTIRRLMSGR